MTVIRWSRVLALAAALCGCLKPQVSDDPTVTSNVLPPGTVISNISDNPELANQILINDGLDNKGINDAGGVLKRTTGKAAGAAVMYWSFGTAKMAGTIPVAAPVYILASANEAGGFTPLTGVPYLLDSIPGDVAYSPIRRIVYVPVTDKYMGEVIASVPALSDAITLGLVGDPTPAGTWVDMVVVPAGDRLELGGAADPMPATKMYARNYQVDVFVLGGDRGVQPLRNGSVPVGQASSLQSGVATGTPPVLPTSFDPQVVFQYGIPAAPPTTTFNYTPLVTELDVRLASGIAPSAVMDDATLYKRGMTGAITGFYTDTVASMTVTTNVTIKQIQFAEGSP